ncbi:MAG: NAD-dependent epimerase/dehydratase family protein [Bacteroidota bacterium]
MKVLVTGATGFIGSHIVDKLLSKGYSVRCIYRNTSNLRWLKEKPVELIEAGLSSKDGLAEAVKGVDYIYHAGGLVVAKNDEEYLKANRDGTVNLLNAALENAPDLKRFLYVSSQTAVGPSKSLDKPVDEATPMKPITGYGRSKKAAEEAVQTYFDKLPITVVRPPAVYGPRDTATLDIFKIASKGLLPLMGFNKKYVSIVHSEDLTRGIIEAAESDKTIGKKYFIASDKFYSWDEIMDVIKTALAKKRAIKLRIPHFTIMTVAGVSEFFNKFSKKPSVFNYEKGLDFIQDYWICSIDNAKKDFGYEQKVSLEYGMQDAIDWYKKNNWM